MDNKLTLRNFERHVSNTILQRGFDYYDEGAIVDIRENKGHWTAEVEGSDRYDVSLTIKNKDEIVDYFCDCPYDGEICKHLVAVFFEVRARMGQSAILKTPTPSPGLPLRKLWMCLLIATIRAAR